MTDIMQVLTTLKRPRLLIRAARFGMADYDRNRDLKRLCRISDLPAPLQAVTVLMQEEAQLEEIRRAGDASYSVARHVDILIALMAEARLIPTGPRPV